MIVLKGISKSYHNQGVLEAVDLEIPRGSIQALLGANGAGKSTLIHIISGLSKPDSGTIVIDEEEITIDSYEYRKKVGYVFEHPMYIEKFSAREYLEFTAALLEISRQTARERIDELLDFFELPSDNSKYIEKYSKGMRSKVSLAAAVLHSPKYLILDEPFDGIDFLSIQKLIKLLKSMSEKGVTILVTSHQYENIAEVCNRFALLKEGEVKFNVSMSQLISMAKNFEQQEGSVKYFLESIMSNGKSSMTLTWI